MGLCLQLLYPSILKSIYHHTKLPLCFLLPRFIFCSPPSLPLSLALSSHDIVCQLTCLLVSACLLLAGTGVETVSWGLSVCNRWCLLVPLSAARATANHNHKPFLCPTVTTNPKQ